MKIRILPLLIFVSLIFTQCEIKKSDDKNLNSEVIVQTKDSEFQPNQNTNNTKVEDYADSTFFSLDILNNRIAHNYFIDRNKKNCVVMTEEIQSLDKFFSPENIAEAIKCYRKNNKDPKTINLNIITTISIKKNDKSFEDICFFSNAIYLHEDGTIGIHEFEMKLKDTLIKTKNRHPQKSLQVIMKLDEGRNERTYLMNFAYNQNSWKLVSKERHSNSSSDIENGERYCIDTTNVCNTSEKGVEISFECLLSRGNRVCK